MPGEQGGEKKDVAAELKAFQGAIDSVEKDLRRMILGQDNVFTEEEKRLSPVQDDDGEDLRRERQQQKFLIYRFKRRISDPPPPLEAFQSQLEPLPKPGTHKMEENMRSSRFKWIKRRRERAKETNKILDDRSDKLLKQRMQELGCTTPRTPRLPVPWMPSNPRAGLPAPPEKKQPVPKAVQPAVAPCMTTQTTQ